ncbi:hypothetical protein [Paenibacillus campinasensis]|uniref:Uncharacterized protein n=1 Tax=Paenibacillus campinasensis TaxID=66347 RepID=A0A268ELE9_9BACL|nr:hypothetical protein [Paenibacillus campinasensis]PAD73942.1 hypothetical protein CHH67_19095 [Paenibacillus campinasensis]
MKEITPKHLAFVDEAAKAFEDNPKYETYYNADRDLIALRFGADRDCIKVYELGEPVGFFVQQVTIRTPLPRKEVARFAMDMEEQLRANELKGGWKVCSNDYLLHQLYRNAKHLELRNHHLSHSELRRRCANIANYAMMLSDNDRREEEERASES